MEEVLDSGIPERDSAFFVLCPYVLDGLDVPELGPYPTRESALRAQDEIIATVTGNCA